jgi:hypothetical protein
MDVKDDNAGGAAAREGDIGNYASQREGSGHIALSLNLRAWHGRGSSQRSTAQHSAVQRSAALDAAAKLP